MSIKEVLVAFKSRKRTVKFEASDDLKVGHSRLLNESLLVFDDMMSLQEGPSSGSQTELPKFYFEIESKKWDGQLIELTGAVEDGSTLYLCQEHASPMAKVYYYVLGIS